MEDIALVDAQYRTIIDKKDFMEKVLSRINLLEDIKKNDIEEMSAALEGHNTSSFVEIDDMLSEKTYFEELERENIKHHIENRIRGWDEQINIYYAHLSSAHKLGDEALYTEDAHGNLNIVMMSQDEIQKYKEKMKEVDKCYS